jgi:malonyl-CoA O-methyltransferase
VPQKFAQDFALDSQAVRRAFNRAGPRFDTAAVLHREVRERALRRLRMVRQPPGVILDLGAGTTAASRWLAKEFAGARVIALDNALGMLRSATRGLHRWFGRPFSAVGGDAHHLPLRDRSVDWVFSNLMLSYCRSADAALAEVRRVLKPGGLLACTVFGPHTLHELRSAWQHDAYPRVHGFLDMHDLGDALVRLKFAEPVLDTERFTLTYADFFSLARDLRAMGSTNALAVRARGLAGRGSWDKAATAYEHWRTQGTLPATFEVTYVQAWAPPQEARPGGEIHVPVGAISRRRSEHPGHNNK